MNIHEAKTNFSKLVAEAEEGREVVITRAGKPVAKLVPLRAPGRRHPGAMRGLIWIAPDFDRPDDEILAAFEDNPVQ